jgi:SAM-dependent methyltransferase
VSTKSNVVWKFWGRVDPLWAVAAWKGRRKDGANPWTEEEFYALGQSDWRDFLERWQRFGVAPGKVVEIGCGAGRITRPMAEYFDSVHALDVSQEMMDFASRNIDANNVRFSIVEDCRIPEPVSSVDAAFSVQVFQHLEEQRNVEDYFREIHRVLAPGGSMMIHVPIFAWPVGAGDWVKRVYGLGRRVENYRLSKARRALEAGGSVGLMRMRAYPIRFFYDFLPKVGFEDVEIGIFATRSNGDPHPFVFARKAMKA